MKCLHHKVFALLTLLFILAASCTTPRAYEQKLALDVFPNPCYDTLYVKVYNGLGATRLSILDMNANCLRTRLLGFTDQTYKFCLDNLDSGIYVAQLKFGDSMQVKKFVKL